MKDLNTVANLFVNNKAYALFMENKDLFVNERGFEEFLDGGSNGTIGISLGYVDENGYIKPARLSYPTGVGCYDCTKEFYGKTEFPETALEGAYQGMFWRRDDDTGETWFDVVVSLLKDQVAIYSSLSNDAILGYEWDCNRGVFFPIRKEDITEIRERP